MKRKAVLLVTAVVSLCLISGCQKAQSEAVTEAAKSSSQGSIKIESTTQQNEESETQKESKDSSEAVLNVTLAEDRIVKDQTFPVDLNDWGNVTFVTYGPDPGADFEDVTFYLMKDKKVVYEFPFLGENNKTDEFGGLFESVASVGFRDVNHDNLKDVIVIINYITGAGPQGMEPRPRVRIFLADGKKFILAKDLMQDITDHMEENNLTINNVYEYLKNK
ncbi:MAG: hypothetical protein KIC73_08865 [Clostridiales bacterium]|nr:hypothetical protein [Clostridiales bacterium]